MSERGVGTTAQHVTRIVTHCLRAARRRSQAAAICTLAVSVIGCFAVGWVFLGPRAEAGNPTTPQSDVREESFASRTAAANVEVTLGPCPGEGDCCVDNGTPGCDDADCCATVCAADPFCCDFGWDGICAALAQQLCGALCPVVCAPDCGKLDIECVNPGPRYDNRTFVGRLLSGGSAFCTAWIVASNGVESVIMTNNHCIVGDVTTFQVQFNRECDACAGGAFKTTTEYNVTGLITQVPALDYALLTVAGDPAAVWGQARMDPRAQVVGLPIYEIHHGGTLAKGYDEGTVTATGVDACVANENSVDVIASGGASGSPVFRQDNDCATAICNCGPNCEPGFVVPMSNIVPDATPSLAGAGFSFILCTDDEVKFSQPPSSDGEDIESNIDWVDDEPNVVVADDFTSDGRPITGVRWWGSNLRESGPICGDNAVNQPSEQCDGTDDAACPGLCRPDCTCAVLLNDNCALAGKVSEGTFPFTNLGATTDGPDEFPVCDFFGDTIVASDVWVCYNPTCSGTATASLCGSGYDTKIAVYDGCTCPAVPSAIACNDDACGGTFQSDVFFPVTAGQSFLLRIGGFSGDQGNGTLTITCTPSGGPCNVVNGGFENGNATGWTTTNNGLPEFFPWTVGPMGSGTGFHFSSPLSGAFDVMNGFDGEAGLVYELFQDVTLPAGQTVTLTTNHRIQFDSLGIPSVFPRELDISIRDTSNVVLVNLFHQDVLVNGAPNTDLGWNNQVFDISAFAGQTVRIHFQEFIPESFTGPALIEFDDISLVCTTSSSGNEPGSDPGQGIVTREVISLGRSPRKSTVSFEELRARYEMIHQLGAAAVLLDPSPLPSSGSEARGEEAGDPRWGVLDDFVASSFVPPLLQSDPGQPVDEQTEAATPSPRISFDGVIDSPATNTPPDTHIAVGAGLGSAGRVIMVTNGHVEIWDKNGGVVAGPLFLDTMFSTNVFDPKVLYDQHSGRFFIVALQRTTSPDTSTIFIAVSSNGTPNNLTSDWTFLSGSALTSIGGVNTWADYPGIGADSDSLFITTNQFDFTTNCSGGACFQGIKFRVFNKASLLAGVYGFVDIDFDDAVTNVSTTMPAHVYGTTTTGGFYLISRIGSTSYRLFHVTGDPVAPVAATGTFSWSGGTFPSDRGADQCTVANPDLATLASRVMTAIYRSGHIWLSLTADPDNDGETEVVWQDIMPNSWPSATPSVFQSGFINGTGTNPWTYMPSINVNAAGDAAMTYTQSSTTECPAMYYVSRLSTAALGTFEPAVLAKTSPGFYDSFSTSDPDRWGDYSATVVDPTDDCFWVANEFVFSSGGGSSEWGTFIASFCTRETGPPIDVDGWFISFHLPLDEMKTGAQEEPLALYYCDADVVDITPTTLPACDGHPVEEYVVNLDLCCLVHANVDPRTGAIPATKDAFFEGKCAEYLIDIQAVVGHEFIQEPGTLECIEVPTGKSLSGPFWGWHTAPFERGLTAAVTTSVKMGPGFCVGGPLPGLPCATSGECAGGFCHLDWLYGPWTTVVPVCSTPNMAFELLTTTPGGSPDENDNGIPDQCECCVSNTPNVVEIPDTVGGNPLKLIDTNRTLIIRMKDDDCANGQAIRVTYTNLDPPHDLWNGQQLWVTEPKLVSENGGSVAPIPGIESSVWASLECTTDPHCRTDWSSLGDIHVFHEGIRPGSEYDIQIVDCDCTLDENAYSPSLPLPTARYGDVVRDCSKIPCSPPEGAINIIDVNQIIACFTGDPDAPRKARCEMEPNCPDLLINITDALHGINGFNGLSYPFPPKDADACDSPCVSPLIPLPSIP